MKKTRFIANAITLALAIPFTALAADQPTLGARARQRYRPGRGLRSARRQGNDC